MFTEGDPSLSHTLTPALGAACCSTDKDQRIYEKQHVGIVLLNIAWQTGSPGVLRFMGHKQSDMMSDWTELNWIKNLPEDNVQDLRVSHVILWNIF